MEFERSYTFASECMMTDGGVTIKANEKRVEE